MNKLAYWRQGILDGLRMFGQQVTEAPYMSASTKEEILRFITHQTYLMKYNLSGKELAQLPTNQDRDRALVRAGFTAQIVGDDYIDDLVRAVDRDLKG